jgi:hypothetical protein
MRVPRTLLVLSLTGMLGGFSVAGAASASTPSAKAPDACSLLTAGDLQRQFGLSFTGSTQPDTGTDCSYFSESPVINVRLVIYPEPNAKAAKQLFKLKSKPPPLSDGTTRTSKKVKGLGDDARYLPLFSTGDDSYLASVLVVRVAKQLLSLGVDVTDANGNAVDDKPAAIALAKVAVGRL